MSPGGGDVAGWTCAACGQESPAGTRFCGHCGTAAAAAPVATWSCRACGTANPEGNAFCGGCGARAQATRTEELRLVTALFADISGFTTLADSLDVESLHEVITPLVRGLTEIAERYEGFIEKFAGDALLVVYGAPVTHEDDAQRALLAALDMHAELPRLLAQIGPHAAHLTIHIGVNTGRVIGRQAGSEQQSDYAVLGDSVILAQRLESACPPDETYVGPTTYELCKDEFDFESVGELTLKGKLKPVQAYRLLGRREPATSAARPLVGRQQELATLDAVLDAAAAGAGAAVVLSGDPGTGKSRLVAELRAHAEVRGARWLAARCLSYGASLPYWPFADLLRQATGVSPQDDADTGQARLRERLPDSSVMGAQRLLGLVEDQADPQRARREVHDAVAAWVTALSADAPVVLCVEDVHWLDSASRDLLGELLRTTRGLRVAIVLTARPEGLAQLEPLVDDVPARRVMLAPLGTDAVPELARAMLGGSAATALVQLLAAKTGGNPLFVEELTCSLKESGALLDTPSGWDIKPGWDASTVPETVERVFATRLDALPVTAAGLLQVASVVGRTVRLSLLSAVAGAEFAGLRPLGGLIDAGLLDRVVNSGEPAVTFHHALLHDVVYGRLLRKRKRELHRRVADVALALYGGADESVDLLARHLYLAEAGEQAVEMLLRAGRRAARLYANDEAALHLERAVEVLRRLPDAAEQLPDVLLELADIQEIRGAYDDAYQLYDEARRATGRAQAWRGMAAVLRKRGDYGAALELLDQTDLDEAALVLERAYSLTLAGRAGTAQSELRRALPAVREETDRALMLLQLAIVHEVMGELSSGEVAAAEAIAIFERTEQPRHAASAHRVAGAIDQRAHRLFDGVWHLQRAQELALRTGAVEEAAGILLNLGVVYMDSGNGEQALKETHRALEIFEGLGHGSGRAVGYGNLADFHSRLGELAEAQEWAKRALVHARATNHVGTLADASRTLAHVRLLQQQWHEAEEHARYAAERFREIGAASDAATCVDIAEQAQQRAGKQSGRPQQETAH